MSGHILRPETLPCLSPPDLCQKGWVNLYGALKDAATLWEALRATRGPFSGPQALPKL